MVTVVPQQSRVAMRASGPSMLAGSLRATISRMTAIRARVHNGRLQLDEPTALPEGTVLDLVVDDEGDDLSDEERAALNEVITRGIAAIDAGQGRPMRDLLAELARR